MTNIINASNANKYSCDICRFKSSKLSNYNTHILTPKHKRLTNPKYKNAENADTKIYKCHCGKEYKHHSSLCKHKNKCNYKEKNDIVIVNEDDNINYKELVMKLVINNQDMQKENQKLIGQITELIPKIGNNNTINNTINNKQKFNITVFLNEKCKDAISMNEFVDKIEVSMKNLLTTKDKGLGEGLSNIIIDNMNKLSLYERPIHCTDRKRETLYIKNDEWKKDDQKEQVNDLIRKVENKQMKNIKQWTDKHTNYIESEQLQKEYINLIKGCTSSIDACSNKIIKKLCDNVYITE